MQYFAFLPLLAASVSALKIQVSSNNEELDGSNLVARHEGAGTSYLFLTKEDAGFNYVYNETTQYLDVEEYDNIAWLLASDDGVLAVSVTNKRQVEILNDYLFIQGQTHYFACNNVNDPYHYSGDDYVVTLGSDIGKNCSYVTLKVVDDEDSSSSAEASSSASSSAVPTLKTRSSAPYLNVTTILLTTTDYVTYCPSATTITVTTCDEKCAPTTITVDEPTTVTVTGTCVFPVTSTAVTSGHIISSSTLVSQTASNNTSVDAESKTPGVSSDNFGNKQAVGSAFLFAGALAMLV